MPEVRRKAHRAPASPPQASPDPAIARARVADLPAIAELASVVWRACYPGIITVQQIDYMLERMYALPVLRAELRSGIRFDLLVVSGKLTGFVSYGPLDRPGVFKLHKLYLHPDWQGRGLGSLLLRHCEKAAHGIGARRLLLNVNKKNTRAIQVYERNGFQIAESVVAKIGGGFVMDDYVMAKELPAQS
jgi:GNAT superfamily N-acetyltransferase